MKSIILPTLFLTLCATLAIAQAPELDPIGVHNQNKVIQNALLATDGELTSVMIDDTLRDIYNCEVIGTSLPGSQFSTFPSADSVLTIWLPDSQGGVVNPDISLCNPNSGLIYIMGREQQNISICNRQTGERVGTILTNKGTMAAVYSETSNKIYCASFLNNNIVEVIDCVTNTIIKIIQLQDWPIGLVWNRLTDEIYCSFYSSPYVSVIDCINDSLIVNIPIGGWSIPFGITFNPLNNKIYCPRNDSVIIIDGNSHLVTATIPVGAWSRSSTINTIHNKVYFAGLFGDNVSIIDGNSDSLVAELSIGSGPYCTSYNSVMDRVYIGHQFCDELYVLDGATDTVIDILHLGAGFSSMAFDSIDNRLFCGLDSWGEIAVIDCNTNSIIDWLYTYNFTEGMYWDPDYNRIWAGNANYIGNLTTYTIFGFAADSLHLQFKTATGFTPYKSCLHRTTNKLFSVSRDDEYLAILDMAHPTSCTLIAVGHGPYDVIENTINNKIYCANRLADTITVLDAITNSIIAQIPSGQAPMKLAFNQTDNKIYCVNRVGNSVTVIDGITNQVLDTIPVGTRPESILWNSIDNKIYVGNSNSQTITIIDASVDTVIATVPSGQYQVTLYHDTINDKIYSANFSSNSITVIDGVSNQVIKTIAIGGPYNFAQNPSANKIYCGCVTGGMIHVIDCGTDSIINSIFVGSSPTALLYNQQANKLFCGYCDTPSLPYPWQDALAIIDCDTDSIITRLILDTNRWSHGRDDRKDALILDSLTNTVYYTHYTSSKISVIDGATGMHEVQTKLSINVNLRVYPNPVQKECCIKYHLLKKSKINLSIYDITGRLVKTIVNEKQNVGICIETIDVADLPQGIYFFRLNTENCSDGKKVILIK